MRATSESRTTSPLEPVFSTISPNSSAVRKRPCALIAIRKSLPPLIGSAPSWPAETWMFCSWMARTTSPAVMPRSDLVRTEPDAHCIVAATEHPYLADAGNARELILDPDIGVVAQVKRIILVVRDQRDQREEGRRLLLRGHPEADHFRRQARQRLGNAVLHVHLRLVRIGAGGEGDRHLQHAV